MTPLERAYRRLLILYPRSFRRAHAEDLVATLLDAAAPGQTRPTSREAFHLLLSGLTWRLRLPSGRPA